MWGSLASCAPVAYRRSRRVTNPPQAASLPHTCKGSAMPSNLEMGLYVFMLATFVGLEVIRRGSPLLHTPLMSLTNAISAISVVGAILIISNDEATTMSKVLGFVAITAATTNIVSGFLITDRMLKMFKRREEKK